MTNESKMNPYRTLDDFIGRFCISTSNGIYKKINLKGFEAYGNTGASHFYSNCAKAGLFCGGLFSTRNGFNLETVLGFSGYLFNSVDVVSSFGDLCKKEKILDPDGFRKFKKAMDDGLQKSWTLRHGEKIFSKTVPIFKFMERASNLISKKIRMPIFFLNVYYSGRIANGVYNFFFEDGHRLNELPDLYELFMAEGLASWSSAIYLRDPDKERD